VVGGALAFALHLAGTDLPIMIFIYAILVPRYRRPTTRYDSVIDGVRSVSLVLFMFFPPGVVKSFLTMRTGNAWVHMWGFHAVSPHVTVDTRLIVRDFDISFHISQNVADLLH
jgi:hypothetical protein